MKFFKGALKLSLIWIVSIFAFSIGFTFFIIFQTDRSVVSNSPEMVMVVFLCIIWFIATFLFALLSSIPGFIFFAALASIVLAIPIPEWIKKMLLISINCFNLFMHGFVGYYMLKDSAFVPGAFSTSIKYITWLPNWTLFIASNLTILLLNFSVKPKKTTI